MSITVMRMMLCPGILGHALNMYCDRIISVFPKGTLNLSNMKEIKKEGFLANLMEGVSPKIPMRSGVLGVLSLVLQYLGYFSFAVYVYGKAPVYGIIMFICCTIFCILGAGVHVMTCLAEYVFLKMGRDEKARVLMLDIQKSIGVLHVCYLGLIAYIVTLIVTIISGAIGFPLWTVIFTILPIFVMMFPLKIVGTLHIAAMASMLMWMILI